MGKDEWRPQSSVKRTLDGREAMARSERVEVQPTTKDDFQWNIALASESGSQGMQGMKRAGGHLHALHETPKSI